MSGSPPIASDFSPDDVSPSGPPYASPCGQDFIENPAPDSLDTEDLHGGLDSYDSRQADNGDVMQHLSRDTPDNHDIPSGDVEDLWMQETIHLSDLRISTDFIHAIRHVTLDDPVLGMSTDIVEHLRNPLHDDPSLSLDQDTRLAIELFLNNLSRETYDKNYTSILRRVPDIDLPSYYRTKCLVADLTGIKSVVHHMCINSCIAYTGPFSELEDCPICSESCYDLTRSQYTSGMARIPQQEFHTIPIGPQLQALYRDPESASHAHYLHEE